MNDNDPTFPWAITGYGIVSGDTIICLKPEAYPNSREQWQQHAPLLRAAKEMYCCLTLLALNGGKEARKEAEALIRRIEAELLADEQ